MYISRGARRYHGLLLGFNKHSVDNCGILVREVLIGQSHSVEDSGMNIRGPDDEVAPYLARHPINGFS